MFLQTEVEKFNNHYISPDLHDINMTNILNYKMLEYVTQEFTFIAENLWNKYSKLVNITKHSKAW